MRIIIIIKIKDLRAKDVRRQSPGRGRLKPASTDREGHGVLVL